MALHNGQVYIIANDLALSVSLSAVNSKKGVIDLSQGKDLGKWSALSWLSTLRMAPDDSLLSMAILGANEYVAVMYRSLRHHLLEFATGNVPKNSAILGKYGVLSDGTADGSSYVLRTNSYQVEPINERTVAWIPTALIHHESMNVSLIYY